MPSVGGLTSPSFETIASLNPDLILMSVAGNARADRDKLAELGFRVFVTNPSNVEGVYASMHAVGRLTGMEKKADTLVASLRQEQERLSREAGKRPARSVLMLLSVKPTIAVGGSTFLHELLSLANARNLAQDAPTSYPMLSREHILGLQPEVLLLMNDAVGSEDDLVATYPEWKSLDALRNKRVAILDANLISRPGPRIMMGLQEIVTALR
jgi:iron complex transport system substrate-binding protein